MAQIFQPFDYQVPMRQWLWDRQRAALFVSPGMGKTAVTLDVLDALFTYGRSKGALIVAPKRVCSITWPNQIRAWEHSKWMRIADLRTHQGKKAWNNGDADIYLINYEQLASREIRRKCRQCKGGLDAFCERCDGQGCTVNNVAGAAELLFKGRKNLPVDTIVWDELSIAKNHKSKRIRALRTYADRFTYHYGLTGTPVPNDYLDLFAQVRLIDGGKRFGPSYHHYVQTYFNSTHYLGYSYELKPGAKEAIDRKISDLALVMKSEDYLDLPTCHSIDVEVELPTCAKKAYKTLEKELLLELEKSDVVALSAASLCTKLLQVVGGCVYDEHKEPQQIHDAKLKAMLKLRKKHGSEPILILSAYRHESDRILKAIPGAQMFDERRLADWQAGKIHTWVADPRSLSHGIDGIQKGGRIAIWYTLTYSNETYIQTNARLVRTGQSQETLIYRILCPGTIDDAVAEALRTKTDTQAGLLTALKNFQQMAS